MPDHDPTAVEAVEKIFEAAWTTLNVPNAKDIFSRIITDAYSPRLTAERDVREKLVDILRNNIECGCAYAGINQWKVSAEMRNRQGAGVGSCLRCTALAAAEKLEDCR